MTTLADALTQIAQAAGLDAAQLIAYAAEDNIGGRDTTLYRVPDWSAMSTHADEGRVIYALVRALRPARVVEIGVASGGTSTHILSALTANDYGTLWSADVEANCGLDVPAKLRDRWTFVVGDALAIDLPEQADFIFEDGAHSYAFTHDVLLRLKDLNPRVLMSHDYYTHEVYGGFEVKRAFDEVLTGAFGLKLDGAFTGLGVWVNPDYDAQPVAVSISQAEITPEEDQLLELLTLPEEEVTADPIAVPRRAAKKRKAARRG